MKKNLISLLFLFTFSSFAQQTAIKGKVLDKKTNQPLTGVHIIIDKNKTVLTDQNGVFSFSADSNSSIVFSLNNYKQLIFKANEIPNEVLLKRNGFVTLGKILKPDKSVKKNIKNGDSYVVDDDEVAEVRSTQNSIYDPAKWNRGGLIGTFDDRERDLVGSPYLNKHFSPGHIYLLKDKNEYSALLRLNVLNNKFEVKVNDKIYQISPDEVLLVECDNKYFVPLNDKSYNLRYFRVIGKYNDKMLLKYTYATKKEDEFIEGKSIGNPKIRISKYNDFFLKSDGSDMLEQVKLKKKYIKKIFDNDSKINTFINRNKLRMKKEKDYDKVFNYYYSTLIE